MLKNAKRKSQNPNEINSENNSMNACMSPDPHMHIFFVACTNYDTLMQKNTLVFPHISLFVQIANIHSILNFSHTS